MTVCGRVCVVRVCVCVGLWLARFARLPENQLGMHTNIWKANTDGHINMKYTRPKFVGTNEQPISVPSPTLARCPIQSHTPTQAAKSLLTISSVLPELLFLSFWYFVWLLKYLHLHLQSVNLFVFCLLDLWAFRIYSLFLRRTHTNSAPLHLTPDFQWLLTFELQSS